MVHIPWCTLRLKKYEKKKRTSHFTEKSNNTGGFHFISLYKVKRIHLYLWIEFPIDDNIIERLEQLAIMEKQSLHLDNHPIFEWSPGIPINGKEV